MKKANSPFLLFTPGPTNTSSETKKAMLIDRGSRDDEVNRINRRICAGLLRIAGNPRTHICVPIQGSGTYAIEATIGSLISDRDKILIMSNGRYGERIAKICKKLKKKFFIFKNNDYEQNSLIALKRLLNRDSSITHVFAVHCETTSGILNPLEAMATVASKKKCNFFVDAMSSFGGIPINLKKTKCGVLISSANKCIEGVPGVSFVIASKKLFKNHGHSRSLSLDLVDQWNFFQKTGQWRFTPPTHVLAALDSAIDQHFRKGGVRSKNFRYRNNIEILINGMRDMGFDSFVPDQYQSPIIATFFYPKDKKFNFSSFYDLLKGKKLLIYPGKLSRLDTFRISCIGQIDSKDVRNLLRQIKLILQKMGVTNCSSGK